MTTDLKSDAIDLAPGLERAAPLGAFARAGATAPPPPEIAASDFLRPLPSHTLGLLGEGPGEPGRREVTNPNGVGGKACRICDGLGFVVGGIIYDVTGNEASRARQWFACSRCGGAGEVVA